MGIQFIAAWAILIFTLIFMGKLLSKVKYLERKREHESNSKKNERLSDGIFKLYLQLILYFVIVGVIWSIVIEL